MQDLRLIGVHEDGQHLLLADSEGNRFRVPLDEPLRAAVRRDRPRLGQLQIEIDGGMRPRDVQALIRAGASAEEVADRSGWSVEKVRRYEGPILAEREHVAGLARGVRLRGRGGSQGSAPTLSTRVGQRLSGRGVDPAVAEWDSGRNDEGEWTVTVTFPAGGRERQARWHFDVAARTVTAADDEARWLSEDEAATAASPIPAPHLVAAPVRATTVYDVEAEGGVAASARRKAATPAQPGEAPREEPVDLMTAMRERASARGRRSSRRKSAPSHTPVDESPRVDALPLEDIAYDPESMPPPPGARGPHPADADAADGVGDDVLPAAADTDDGDTGDTLPVPSTLDSPEPSPAPADADPAADEAGGGAPTAQDEPAGQVPPSAADEPVTTEGLVTTEAPADEAADEAPGETDGPPADEANPTPAAPKEAAKPARRNGRPSVPSWDDVMFGAKPRD
jgi:hypothetical protein